MSCNVGEATESLGNELCFNYVTAHSPTLLSLLLRHSSFSNPSVASPTSQLILQPFFRFSYVTGFSLASLSEPPMHYRSSYKVTLRSAWRFQEHIERIWSTWGRRVIGISVSLIWSKTLMELIFNPCGEFRWNPEGPVSQIHSPHLHVGAHGIFSDL